MYYQINIRKVTAYEYLRSKCFDESFYQWVSERLAKLPMMSRDSKNNQTCKMLSNEPCSSLPTLPSSVPYVDLPPCNSTAAANCYKLIVSDILRSILFKGAAMTTKTCSIQEYELEDRSRSPHSDRNSYRFQYRFARHSSTRGAWNAMPVKTVHVEQLLQTGFTLMGSVGGWFGLMIGFSFYGLADEIIGLVHMVAMKLQ